MHGVQQHLRMTGNDHEQVVEIVRDAACEPSHGVEPLGMMQLFLKMSSFGDVARIHHYTADTW